MGFKAKEATRVCITPPNLQRVELHIKGLSPYIQNAFAQKSMETMIHTQEQGPAGAKKPKREPKDFDAVYQGAFHRSTEGWPGIPASAFRNAMIDACRLVELTMTKTKLCVFVEADGYDALNGAGLVKIIGTPEKSLDHVRLAGPGGATDIRIRPMWRDWSAVVKVMFDADQLTLSDVVNLMHRVGMQVGIGEGRHNSKTSNGTGNGVFTVLEGVHG